MPSDIHRNYGNNVAAIYRDMGRAQADARLQRGQGWANAIGNIGQTLANIPGQMAEQKQQEMRSALNELQMEEVRANLARSKQQDAQTMAIANLVSQATINGQFDKDAFATAAAAQGMGQIVPQVVKTFAEMEQSLIELENAEKTGVLTDAKLAELQQDFLRPLALNLWENKFEPSVVNGVFAAARAMGTPEELVSQWEQMPPEQLSLVVQQLLPSAKAPEPVTLSEGQVRFSPQTDAYGRPVMGPDGQPVMTRMEGNAKPQNLDEMLAAALKAGNRDEVNRIIKTKAQVADATRGPQQGPQPQYQRIETVDGAGNPVIQFMTPEEVRAQGGIKTPPKTTAKASGPATVDAILGEIQTLSDKINTSAGGPMSNITGAMRRGAASANMDNDVSEYLALVEGFIPMVARAVGHTGVLTQQDVDSVRALFPRPGDNAQLSKNKLERVKRIMQQMQAPDAAPAPAGRASGAGPALGASAPMSAEALIKKYGGG